MFYTFDEIKGENNISTMVGKKAESLIRMSNWGLPVPDGGCVTTRGFEAFITENKLTKLVGDIRRLVNEGEDKQAIAGLALEANNIILQSALPGELEEKIDQLQTRNPESRFAVRSSGTKEDLHGASFAGQYSSILNVNSSEHLFHAVKQCWASLFNERVLHYCMNQGIDFSDMSLSVILQTMVQAEKSGVIFTVNPLKGFDREILIEACFGLGEALVGGEVTPDQYIYNWYSGTETQRTIADKRIAVVPIPEAPFVKTIENPLGKRTLSVLSEKEVRELSNLALQIQANYGFPVDIEWAKCRDGFHILQSRPITKINYSGIKGEWTTADFKDGGVSSTVCSQFMWSLYDMIWEDTTPGYSAKVKLLKEKEAREILWGDMFYGRPYWSVTGIKKSLSSIPGYVERTFDESMGIKVAYEGNGETTKTNPKTLMHGIQVLLALDKAFKEYKAYWPRFKEAQVQALAGLDTVDCDVMTTPELYAFYEKFILEEYVRSESTYFYSIYASSNMSSLFKEKFDKMKLDVNYLNLISGLTDLSHMLPIYKLWDLKNAIAGDTESYAFWKNTPASELVALWKGGENGYHLDAVRAYIDEFKFHSTRELDLTVPRYREDPTFVMETIKASLDLDQKNDPRALNKKQHEAYLREREKLLGLLPFYKRSGMDRSLTELRTFLWWREELRDLSTQYYFHVRSFTLALARRLRDGKVIDEVDDIFFLPINEIIALINGRMTSDDAKALIRNNRLYYNSFRNYGNPNEIGNNYLQAAAVTGGKSILTGIPCSPGVVKGKVKVIKDIFDADRIEKGDILITKFTDPGWTPKFGLLAAVATEYGGLLSHAAVISREYGIPAVLAVENITALVKDGQTVTIDGNNGMIVLL